MNDSSFIIEQIVDSAINKSMDKNWPKIQELAQSFSLGNIAPIRTIVEVIVDGVENGNLDSQIDVLKLMMLDANLKQEELPSIIAKVKMKMHVEDAPSVAETVSSAGSSANASKVNAYAGVVMALIQNKLAIALGFLVALVSSFFFPVGILFSLLIACCLSLLFLLGLVVTLYYNPKVVKGYLGVSMALMVLAPVIAKWVC